ncbi:MAG: VTT domain-containing protein [Planctomycetota bacterium]|jgi:membrane protein YqaA with SNARE-associated domain
MTDATAAPSPPPPPSVEAEAIEYARLPLHVYLLGALMIAIGVVTFVLMFVQDHGDGYDLLFLYSIPANAAISVFPHEPVLLYYGKFADLFLVAVVATAGTLVSAYLDHRVFVPILNHRRITHYKRTRFYRKAADYFRRYPFATLVVVGATPLPYWPFKIMAFSIHYPLWRYVLANAVARFPRYWVTAWVGAMIRVPNWILISFVVVVFSAYGIKAGPAAWRRLRGSRPAPVSEDAA